MRRSGGRECVPRARAVHAACPFLCSRPFLAPAGPLQRLSGGPGPRSWPPRAAPRLALAVPPDWDGRQRPGAPWSALDHRSHTPRPGRGGDPKSGSVCPDEETGTETCLGGLREGRRPPGWEAPEREGSRGGNESLFASQSILCSNQPFAPLFRPRIWPRASPAHTPRRGSGLHKRKSLPQVHVVTHQGRRDTRLVLSSGPARDSSPSVAPPPGAPISLGNPLPRPRGEWSA